MSMWKKLENLTEYIELAESFLKVVKQWLKENKPKIEKMMKELQT